MTCEHEYQDEIQKLEYEITEIKEERDRLKKQVKESATLCNSAQREVKDLRQQKETQKTIYASSVTEFMRTDATLRGWPIWVEVRKEADPRHQLKTCDEILKALTDRSLIEGLQSEHETVEVVNLKVERDDLQRRATLLDKAHEYLVWTLPMAKGYAAAHRHKANDEKITEADKVLEDLLADEAESFRCCKCNETAKTCTCTGGPLSEEGRDEVM